LHLEEVKDMRRWQLSLVGIVALKGMLLRIRGGGDGRRLLEEKGYLHETMRGYVIDE
jgi:hypothetical protein